MERGSADSAQAEFSKRGIYDVPSSGGQSGQNKRERQNKDWIAR
jgi:hypothetical protein